MALLELTDRGLYCEVGEFYIDPTRAVERAIITHGHTDHARMGHRQYFSSHTSADIIREQLTPRINLESFAFGEVFARNGVNVSLHPAGHLLGSAQVRVEYRGEVWVVSGDYKTEQDPTCEPFEPVKCHTFITESTFALPKYEWPAQAAIFADIDEWRRRNAEHGVSSIILAYSLGKAQRVLAGVDPSITRIILHPSVMRFDAIYRKHGIALPAVGHPEGKDGLPIDGPMLGIAPPSATRSGWLDQFSSVATAFASGWMLVRSEARRRGLDRGFPLSDHADWKGIHETVLATGAEHILVTHGYAAQLIHSLAKMGLDAKELKKAGAIEKKELDLFHQE